jgi:bla regulator protein BlaR1
MIGAWGNHLWQSTLFAIAVGLVTVAFRNNRAQVRYWLWLSASFKFLLPFLLLMSLGSHLEWRPASRTMPTQIAAPAVSITMAKISRPFPDTLPLAPSTRGSRDWTLMAIIGVWVCGFWGISLIRFRSWLRVRAAVRASTPMDIPAEVEIRSCHHYSPGLLEPGVVGWLHPILLMPADIMTRLTPRQLEAVLVHELCHVRRRDNLTSGIHMIVESLFWFHPLVWWIGARLVEERERACDEEVLRLGSEPHVYAEAILNVCKSYLESPLRCVAGVTGSDLKKRIHEIVTGRFAREMNFAKKLALTVAGTAALAWPIIVGMMNAPVTRAQSTSAAAPKFAAALISPCKDAPGRKRGYGYSSSPGRLNTGCMALVDGADSLGLIQHAYVRFAYGKINPFGIIPIKGGPAWIHSELYMIDAKAAGNPGKEMMEGPMLQTLLQDRFRLKIHRETKEVPVYVLTVASGGTKLQPAKEGSCLALPMTFPLPPLAPGQRYCRNMLGGPKGQNPALNAESATLVEFSRLLSLILDRPIIDRTGITGNFVFHLQFAIDQTTPRYLPGGDMAGDRSPASDPAAPSIFTALQRLGLKLEPIKGPRDFLVIDHVEKPSASPD